MKRTSATALVIVAVIGGVSAALLETLLATTGKPIVIPPLTLAIALLAIGGILIWLALPIRRLTRGTAKAPVDAYYATRILMLAKASSLAGALIVGVGLGITAYLLTRSIVPGVGSTGPAIATIVGAGALLAAGLIAESWCRVPPEDDEDDEQGKRAIRVRP